MSDNKFSWVHAFTDTALPPTTKLILHTICMFMNSRGEGAFPSIETLAEKSGLGVTAVKKHIAIAVDEGWLKKGKHGYAGQQWARNEYYVSYPEQNENAEKKAGRDAADLQNKVGHLATEGGSPDVKKVGREAATNIPVNNQLINNTPKSPNAEFSEQSEFEKQFEQIWNISPNQQGKQKSMAAYQMVRAKGVGHEWILAGVRHYAKNCKDNRQSAKLLYNWFRDEGWTDVPPPDQPNIAQMSAAAASAAQLTQEASTRYSRCLEIIKQQHGAGTVKSFFSGVQLVEGRGGALTMVHPRKFALSRIRANYLETMRDVYSQSGGGSLSLVHVDDFKPEGSTL